MTVPLGLISLGLACVLVALVSSVLWMCSDSVFDKKATPLQIHRVALVLAILAVLTFVMAFALGLAIQFYRSGGVA